MSLVPLVIGVATWSGVPNLSAALMCSSALLFLGPLPGDDAGIYAAVTCLVTVLLSFSLLIVDARGWILYSMVPVIVIKMIVRIRGSMLRTRLLIHGGAIWQLLVDSANLVHLSVWFILLLFWISSLQASRLCQFLVLFAALLYYCLKYWSVWSGRTLLISASKERIIKGAARDACSLRPELPSLTPDEEMRTNALYNRILDELETNKTFLDPNLELSRFSMAVLSNKGNVSRAINLMSGMHFCAFINVYRIEYAKNLIRRDKRLKILEVSEMSGFNSTVTFNNAFKINTGMTPTEFKEMYGGTILPSSSREQEPQ